MTLREWVLGLVVSLAAFSARDAGACSCSAPVAAMITPDHGDDVPLNARVRATVPAQGMGRGGRLVLRRRGYAEETAAKTETMPASIRSVVELTPSRPLEPGARYEVLVVDPRRYPSEIVFGTFRTGSATDKAAPRLESGGTSKVERSIGMSNSCAVPGPWVRITGLAASDPGRAGAQLAIGVWLGDASGRVDDTLPPTTIAPFDKDGDLTLGSTSVCDSRTFPLPASGPMWIGLAALDEAGNRSAVRRMRVDLGAATP